MKNWIIIICLFYVNLKAQINIEYLSDVPTKFKQEYYSKPRIYNPLQIGNIWQYYDSEYDQYSTIRILQDSIINGRKYFKKLYYPEFTNKPDANIAWERNDTVSGITFMLDFEDINENGDTLEELPIDSLENPFGSRYKSYKYAFKDSNSSFMYKKIRTVLVKDTSWAIIESDTVMTRYFEILELFWGEQIADKFGIIFNNSESPNRILTGAVINGKKYGTIVSVETGKEALPNNVLLLNNYPNPFNPTTKIEYSVPTSDRVTLKIYDNLGREVATLVNGFIKSGKHSVIFNAKNLSSGIYYYRLETRIQNITKAMILLK